MKIKHSNLIELARDIAPEPPYAVMHSGQMQGRSYLAFDAQEQVKASDFSKLKKVILETPDGWWAGYFGYGLKNQFEELAHDIPSPIHLPDMHWIRFGTVIRLDHENGKLEIISGRLPNDIDMSSHSLPVRSLHSDNALKPQDDKLTKTSEHTTFTREDYLRTVSETIEAINSGAFYEANITQKYWGKLQTAPKDSLALFASLASAANTPYSALLCLDEDTHIYSASPECFLKSDAVGNITSLPIKGTIKRGENESADEALKAELHQSEKNRAENLMIVDLIRNDLARVCKAGSVHVEKLYNIQSYETIHHMVSHISGELKNDATTLDAIAASFPPGSMTGAPKIAAMEWCSQKEQLARGVYSGALGWIAGDGSADLSVVIRTLIVQGNRYEYQMGGAIIADSDPQEEWKEMRLKAKVIESLFA